MRSTPFLTAKSERAERSGDVPSIAGNRQDLARILQSSFFQVNLSGALELLLELTCGERNMRRVHESRYLPVLDDQLSVSMCDAGNEVANVIRVGERRQRVKIGRKRKRAGGAGGFALLQRGLVGPQSGGEAAGDGGVQFRIIGDEPCVCEWRVDSGGISFDLHGHLAVEEQDADG